MSVLSRIKRASKDYATVSKAGIDIAIAACTKSGEELMEKMKETDAICAPIVGDKQRMKDFVATSFIVSTAVWGTIIAVIAD